MTIATPPPQGTEDAIHGAARDAVVSVVIALVVQSVRFSGQQNPPSLQKTHPPRHTRPMSERVDLVGDRGETSEPERKPKHTNLEERWPVDAERQPESGGRKERRATAPLERPVCEHALWMSMVLSKRPNERIPEDGPSG